MSGITFGDGHLIVGDVIQFGPTPKWWVRAWRWMLRVILRRKNVPSHLRRVLAVNGSTITIEAGQ